MGTVASGRLCETEGQRWAPAYFGHESLMTYETGRPA
jgi:hypothetical protein